MPGSSIPKQLEAVRNRLIQACERAGRDPKSVGLIAVSKTFPAAAIREAMEAGQSSFGESRLQEAEPKLAELPRELNWHFIGRVQRNKVRKILPLFGTIHGIDSAKLAHHMDRIAGELDLQPTGYLQVNLGGEQSKGGFAPDELEQHVEELFGLQHVRIRGLMCIPPFEEEQEAVRRWFVELRTLRDQLCSRIGIELPELSMGMSGDYEVAIEEGATQVRVGSAIFGGRE